MERTISIRGARTHNLRDISLEIPHNRLIVVTGVSGSGKSSLVFDTLYAEGQRRYVQSLSTYARLFLERMERPDVDSISDIPPALALRQKNTIKNARSTVGSVTEINDYLRLLFATIGRTICPTCGTEVARDTVEGLAARTLASPGLYLFLAPFENGTRAADETCRYLIQNGYLRLYMDGRVVETADFAENGGGAGVDAPLMVVIDRVATASSDGGERVRDAAEKAFHLGGGRARVIRVERAETGELTPVGSVDYDRRFNCARCDRTFPEPTPALFSANSPIGACPECEGFGRVVELDLEKVIPDSGLSIRQGLVAPWRTPAYAEMKAWMLKCARRAQVSTVAPFREMTEVERTWLLDGEPRREGDGEWERWPGVRGFFRWLEKRRYKTHVRILLARYRRFVPCPACGASKLKAEALNVRVDGRSIAEVGKLSVRELKPWIEKLGRDRRVRERAAVLIRELRGRIGVLDEVGLGYLTVERQARTLSGGEAQRIHLAGALGSLLTGTLYALDEPTVGLHAGDVRKLIGVLRHLRDLGNTVVVVEHDPAMIHAADFAIELGPGGGREGGRLIRAGAPTRRQSAYGPEPGRVLLMRALARERRFDRRDPSIRIVGAREHNLKNLDLRIPLGRMVCVSGVSGSGKSTLVEDVLYNNYQRRIGEPAGDAGACDRIEGLEAVGAMVHMGQELPARSMRSNPSTYLKIYDDIRKLFAQSPEARRLGIPPGHFSFNVAGGRCEKCQGSGSVTIEMHFMADLDVRCEVCDGRRFQPHILGIRFNGKNVNEVLDLTVDEARGFFSGYPAIMRRLEALNAVGLGYLALGQATSTLSGGEAQRLKLARFLLADLEPPPSLANGKPAARVFLLDEPTTGLSSTDTRRLMKVFARLVSEGNSLIVIEHNLEVLAQADYLIDLGPGGGDDGGKVVAAGLPTKVAASPKSITGAELRRTFGMADAIPRRSPARAERRSEAR